MNFKMVLTRTFIMSYPQKKKKQDKNLYYEVQHFSINMMEEQILKC